MPTASATPGAGAADITAADAPGTPGTAGPRRRGRRGMVVLTELVHAVAFVPLVVAAIPLLLAFRLATPLLAEADRALARSAGADAPSALPSGAGRWPWLLGRVTQAGFWKQDLPLLLGGALLSTISFFIVAAGGSLVGVLAASPLLASPERPIELTLSDLPGWSRTATSFGQIWWTEPIALACLALVLGLLVAMGRLRCRMTAALSRPDDEARLAALRTEVGHLTTGRATLVDAFDAERARIERDLHDGAQQRLVALAMRLGTAELHAGRLAAIDGADGADRAATGAVVARPDPEPADTDPEPADADRAAALAALRAGIQYAQDEVEAALRSLRETVHGIRPAVLTERGLAPALRDLAGRAPLPTAVTVVGEDADLTAITSPVATTAYFAVAEALTNAAKHAGPDARARVEVTVAAKGLSVIVADDGAGGADPHAPGSTGLAGMAHRVESIGGRLDIDSPRGAGTRLTLTAPLTPPWARD